MAQGWPVIWANTEMWEIRLIRLIVIRQKSGIADDESVMLLLKRVSEDAQLPPVFSMNSLQLPQNIPPILLSRCVFIARARSVLNEPKLPVRP
jgi:hypothetical protein